MKRVTAIFLSIILAVSLAACGQAEMEQPEDTRTDVRTKSSENNESRTTDADVEDNSMQTPEMNVDDGFIRITGSTFQMGSSDPEAWRSEDETQHPVTVSDFYMAPQEVTQAEYETVMGSNPSNFSGSDLPGAYPDGEQTDPVGAATGTESSILIAYFSWGGNTRGIAEEIQSQTGADPFEITLVNPYSSDYNTVLDEAQRDQNEQARPELASHVENMDDYDTIIYG